MHNKNQNFSLFLRFFDYIKVNRIKLFIATLSTILHNFFDILPDILIGMAVDVVVNKQHSFIAHLGIDDVMMQLCLLAMLVFVVWSLEAFCQYVSQVSWMTIAQLVQHDLRVQAYQHVQLLQMSYFENKNA